jgi:hypothetical protein
MARDCTGPMSRVANRALHWNFSSTGVLGRADAPKLRTEAVRISHITCSKRRLMYPSYAVTRCSFTCDAGYVFCIRNYRPDPVPLESVRPSRALQATS